MKTKIKKNIKSLKNSVAMIVLALTVVCSAMSFSIPSYAISADAIPNGTPVIDGVMEDMWNNASNKIVIDVVNLGSTTATGYARLMWDSQYLYVLGCINDSTLVTAEGPGNRYWHSDSLEVFLDEANAHSTVKNDIAQLRVSRQGVLSGMLLSTVADEATVKASYPNIKRAAKNTGTSGNYVVELAIPWTKATGAVGTQIGIEFQINDMQNAANVTVGADAILNSEVIDVWQCITYRMMTLSATKADSGSGATTGGNNTTTGGNNTTTGGNNTTTGGNNTTTGGNNTTTGADNTTTGADNTTTDVNNTTTGADNTTTGADNTTTGADNTTTDVDNKEVNNNKDSVTEESSNSGLMTVIIIVAAVVLLVLAGCVAVIIISKKKRK